MSLLYYRILYNILLLSTVYCFIVNIINTKKKNKEEKHKRERPKKMDYNRNLKNSHVEGNLGLFLSVPEGSPKY